MAFLRLSIDSLSYWNQFETAIVLSIILSNVCRYQKTNEKFHDINDKLHQSAA